MCLTLLIPIFGPNLINLTFNILLLLTFGWSYPKKPAKVPHQAFIYEEQEALGAQFNDLHLRTTIVYHCFDTKDDLVQLGHW